MKKIVYYEDVEDFLSTHEINSSSSLITREMLSSYGVKSSYLENNYGTLFASLVSYLKPKVITELGVLGGYSLLTMAQSSKQYHSGSNLFGYDLFEDYPYNSFKLETLERMVSMLKLNNVSLFKTNVLKDIDIEKLISESNLIHIDLSNDGGTVADILKLYEKSKSSAILIFEGGSVERDQVRWMKTYNKNPINPVLERYAVNASAEVSIIKAFPSVTVIARSKL